MGCCNTYDPFIINPLTGLPYPQQPPASCNCPPSPIPPWHRAIDSPIVQTLTQAGSIDLTTDTTYLVQTLNIPSVPVSVAMPDGNFKRQIKRVYIPSDKIATTETFILTGHFAGFSNVVYSASAYNGVYEWDGAGWQIIGGNVQPGTPSAGGGGSLIQTLTGAGTADLTKPITYLQATTGPNAIVLPNGTYNNQQHSFFVPAAFQATTGTFNVSGTFTGSGAGSYTTLTLDTLGTAAVLVWDGAGWQLVGGNGALS